MTACRNHVGRKYCLCRGFNIPRRSQHGYNPYRIASSGHQSLVLDLVPARTLQPLHPLLSHLQLIRNIH